MPCVAWPRASVSVTFARVRFAPKTADLRHFLLLSFSFSFSIACSSSYAETPHETDGGTTPPANEDASAPPDASVSDAPSEGCSGKLDCVRIVFVSSERSSGKLGDGGLAGADALCQRLGDAGSKTRGRRFRAWLSTDSTPAAGRLPHGTQPYRRTDGVEIASSFAQLVAGPIANPLNVDENGEIVATTEVWTGTGAAGGQDGDLCEDWTATTQAATGRQGNAARIDTNWTSDNDFPCNVEARVYCFEN
jgi:hypothetical protein